jgi:hypothetical protein
VSHCPWCHAVGIDQGYDDNDPPVEGDLSICWSCRQIGTFTSDGSVRMPTKQEYETFMADPEVRKVIGLAHTSPTPESFINRWRSS